MSDVTKAQLTDAVEDINKVTEVDPQIKIRAKDGVKDLIKKIQKFQNSDDALLHIDWNPKNKEVSLKKETVETLVAAGIENLPDNWPGVGGKKSDPDEEPAKAKSKKKKNKNPDKNPDETPDEAEVREGDAEMKKAAKSAKKESKGPKKKTQSSFIDEMVGNGVSEEKMAKKLAKEFGKEESWAKGRVKLHLNFLAKKK